jgi:hypothetical protein
MEKIQNKKSFKYNVATTICSDMLNLLFYYPDSL